MDRRNSTKRFLSYFALLFIIMDCYTISYNQKQLACYGNIFNKRGALDMLAII